MAVRPVLHYPHAVLKQKAAPLEPGSTAKELSRDLHDTMSSFRGCVGIAAPQINELFSLVVVDVSGHKKATASHGLLVLLNPQITHSSGSEIGREGCLSIPDLTANVRRATEITVQAQTPQGEEIEFETEGFEARCIQHEIDHLNGVLFLDRVESLTDDVFRRKRY